MRILPKLLLDKVMANTPLTGAMYKNTAICYAAYHYYLYSILTYFP
jgi:hypothetical protein